MQIILQKGVMNQIKVHYEQAIYTLAERGFSNRRIARDLGIHRETVSRYLKSKPAKVHTGFADLLEAKPATQVHTGIYNEDPPKPAKVHTGSASTQSSCYGYERIIQDRLLQGLSIIRIFQGLKVECGFSGNYYSVRRYTKTLNLRLDPLFRRMETRPGEEMQVDFGQGAWIIDAGKRRRPHLFRAVLSFSRKAYSEVVYRQDTESFLRCLENAFRYFGGVTLRIVSDNLKAAVIQADWFDPQLNPKMIEFCNFYKTTLIPTKPATPRHKGKIEAGIKYVQDNALKKRTFSSLADQNKFLEHWERSVADTRIHGTVKQQVACLFKHLEASALRSLPQSLFPCFHEARRTVQRDGYIEFARAYYSVPCEFVGSSVWIRSDGRLVHIFNDKMQQISVHSKANQGFRSTDQTHISPRKRSLAELGVDALINRCQRLGPSCGAWAYAVIQNRGPEAVRTLQGLIYLAREHPIAELEHATHTALQHACFRFKDIRSLLKNQITQLSFIQSHPIIRDMNTYQVAF